MLTVPDDLRQHLRRHQQEHVLAWWDELDDGRRRALLDQLKALDLPRLRQLYEQRDHGFPVPTPEQIKPVPVIPADDPANAARRRQGEEALRRGEVAVLVVAGGQGSRLGFDHPKGLFPIGPVSHKTLFQIHAEKVQALGRRHGELPPFLVMTSPATHEETAAFFAANQYFGLPSDEVHLFCQGTMPALDRATGKLLMEDRDRLFLSPDGHGGTLTALSKSGLRERLRKRGVRHVFYFQVDNPLVKVCDPGLLGRHIETGSEASSKVVFKEQPGEKVGVLAVLDGRCGIVEYSDLPAEWAQERDAAGGLVFRAGSPAIHAFSLDFLERVTARGGVLRHHVARKKVPHFDPATGAAVEPPRENALKFERFIFDALPAADRWLVVETRREEEFAPLKNATGADSPETVFRLMTRLHAGWLERAGVATHGHPVEVSPLFALDADECRAKLPRGFAVTGPTLVK